ncbi:sugar O-acetyltransferase [Ancylobacter polymorphus]|uniref:Maltose O-acetyltransferase n=1 Tax=Ancylobacter polymorphus TaxID=223390 RepID=A0ABU0B7Y2_9HYPH|nr:sugar O-acetyltransferase [Ancylobacter polymorphus]MDQ0301936.1 maltose O-acetyltransferase [Ancylobacter polymorphus]
MSSSARREPGLPAADDPRSEMQRMRAGELYRASDPAIQAAERACFAWLARFNASLPLARAERRVLLAEGLGTVGERTGIRPPFHCDYGFNIHLGTGVFLNFDCVILDVVAVHIGDGTEIGPGTHIYTAEHPRDPEVRRLGLEYGRPVSIGRNVWIGGKAIILPGITIGDDAVIGAGAVVTRDIPAGATAVGNPARILAPRPAG